MWSNILKVIMLGHRKNTNDHTACYIGDNKHTTQEAQLLLGWPTVLPVVKLTLTLTLTGHNLAKNRHLRLNGLIMRQNEAYRAIFCTLKTTSGFIFLLPVV